MTARPGSDRSERAAPTRDDDPGEVARLFGVLVTYRRPTELTETLRRISAQDRELEALVVVDNAPHPQVEAVVRDFADGGRTVHYLPTDENVGPAGGIAVGMARVLELARDDDWIVLLDDDDPPLSSTWFRELSDFARATVEDDPRTAAVGFGGARFDWSSARLVRPPFEHYVSPMAVDYFASGHLPMYRVGAIRDVGTFERLLFFGLDDLEFGLRLRHAGYALYGLRPPRDVIRAERPKLKAKRRIGRRFRLADPEWRGYYSLRNLIYIVRSSGRPALAMRITLVRGVLKPIANGFLTPRQAWRQLRLNQRACRDAWRRRMGRTLEPGQV